MTGDEPRYPAVLVTKAMTRSVESIRSDASAAEAADRMRETNVKKVPVLEDGEIVGILTITDIAKYLPTHRVHPDE